MGCAGLVSVLWLQISHTSESLGIASPGLLWCIIATASTLCNAALLLDKQLLLLYLLLLLLKDPAVVAEGSLHALIRDSEAHILLYVSAIQFC